MKIKLQFTEEHIALIKALNFERIDFDSIIRTFEQYNQQVTIVPDVDSLVNAVENAAKYDIATQPSRSTTPILSKYDKIINGNTSKLNLGDVLEKYRITIDSVYGLDNFNLWGGTYIWEQMAYILGIYDHVIKGTEEDPTGPKFPEEDMEHMKDLDAFIITHLNHIFQILLQFCTEGIQPGVTYWCYDYENIWHKEA